MPLPLLIKNGEIDIEVLRKEYLKAVEDPKGIDYLLQVLQKAQSSHPLVIAFHACLETLKAKSLWNPLEKLSMAKQSQQTFSKAILLNPNHLEIRFLRYSIQLSLPAYLYLSTNLEEDKQMIIKAVQNNPHDIEPENLQIIVSFLLKDGQLSASEKESILNAMNRF